MYTCPPCFTYYSKVLTERTASRNVLVLFYLLRVGVRYISEGARYNGIAVSVKTAGTAVLAAIRMKRGISGVGATATVAAESEGAAAESLDPELLTASTA